MKGTGLPPNRIVFSEKFACPVSGFTIAEIAPRLFSFNAPQGAATRYAIDRSGALDGSGIETLTLPPADQYRLQAEAFSRAVRDERPDASAIDDAAANLRVIDALFASERSGRFEPTTAVAR